MDPQWRVLQIANLISKINYNVQNNLGCQFWSTQFAVNQRERLLTRGPKYGRLKITMPDGTKKTFLAHRLMYLLHSDHENLDPNMHVSHICHNSLCINIEHLSYEEPHINNSRKVCTNLHPPACQHHENKPDCIF